MGTDTSVCRVIRKAGKVLHRGTAFGGINEVHWISRRISRAFTLDRNPRLISPKAVRKRKILTRQTSFRARHCVSLRLGE
jgi:hypothetical protein